MIRRTKKERSNVTVKTCDLVFTRLYHCNLAAYQVFEEMSKRKFNASCVASPLAWYQFLCCLQLGCVISFFNFIISLFHSAEQIYSLLLIWYFLPWTRHWNREQWGRDYKEGCRVQSIEPYSAMVSLMKKLYWSWKTFFGVKEKSHVIKITSVMELQMIQDYMYSAVANDTSVL